MTDATAKLKPGYWVAFCPWYGSNEIVSVSPDGKSFTMMGYDCPTSVNAEDWRFIKHFDIEDVLNEGLSAARLKVLDELAKQAQDLDMGY
jgi:hypothetical protein